MKREALRHPKMLDLSSRLGISRTHAVGIVQVLLDWCADTTPQGNIGRWPDGAIARACEWTGEPEAFIEALVGSGWVDRCPRNRLVIHDLADHAEQWWKRKMEKLGLVFLTAEHSAEPTAEATAEPTAERSAPRDRTEPLLTKPKRRAAAVVFVPEILPTGFDTADVRIALENFLTYRVKIGKPYKTQDSVESLVKKWSRAGPESFTSAVETTIANGWQGLIEPNGKLNGKSSPEKPRPLEPHEFDQWDPYSPTGMRQ